MVRIGLDVGSVSLKLAILGEEGDELLLHRLVSGSGDFFLPPAELGNRLAGPAAFSRYRRLRGNLLESTRELLDAVFLSVPREQVAGLRVTGSSAALLARTLDTIPLNEFKAIARAATTLYPEVRTIFEVGGGSSKYLLLDPPANHRPRIRDYGTNGDCAAGTGSFLDQQAFRLGYRVEEIGAAARSAKCSARIAGRCSVFAKSDMIHAQQKGFATEEILKGLCEAVARNFKANIVRGRPALPRVALTGGVAQNEGVRLALTEAFRLAPDDLFVPELYAWLGALGAALASRDESQPASAAQLGPPEAESVSMAPLSLENVTLLRARTVPYAALEGNGRVRAYLGIDVGSVSTNLAVLDDEGRLLHEIYLRTAGRPIEVVHEGLQTLERLLGERIEVAGAGTTGSGRELIGELVGADCINDEITAHKTGALFVSEKMLGAPVDTIFEIGGQDSKFISIENGVVVDFSMNEACAAGTGSFLEEQAEELGVRIESEFARMAFSSRAPVRLGERCTVFMGRDVHALLQNGAAKPDLCAGLAYSIALNYLNRVVRGRKIGQHIFFQGGTAYNDAVAAAFAALLGQHITVPPHNGVMGAIGEALIARDWALGARRPSAFRGYNLTRTKFTTREFVCRACSNLCEMREITVDGRKTYWGDKCSDKFRKPVRSHRVPVIEDLLALRDRLLLDAYEGPRGGRPKVGVPRAMYFYDRFPFWRHYLEGTGFDAMLSGASDRSTAALGVELSVAEPCFPVQMAHGHVKRLLDAGADYVLLPNVMTMGTPHELIWHLCPWNQTLPFVVRAAPGLSAHARRILSPTLHFQEGRERVKSELAGYFGRLGVSRRCSDTAADRAFAAQAKFEARLLEAGRGALAALESTGEPAVLLVGRAYNLYDRDANCDIPRKLRTLYGVNVLPYDFLPLDLAAVDDFHPRMFWYSGRRILAAGLFAKSRPWLHIVYVTNFKCGPDSFLKSFERGAADAPLLVLQFDGHGNDAGYLTRCEAYLDSKGVLRCHALSA